MIAHRDSIVDWGIWRGLSYRGKLAELRRRNWHVGDQVRATCEIFRRRPRHVAEGGRCILGWIDHHLDGWRWRDRAGNGSKGFRSKPDAVFAFAHSREWTGG